MRNAPATHRPPDVTRAGVGTVLISPWIVKTRERQRAAIDATLREWQRRPWPEGFISLNCFASTDGATVLNYAQWSCDEAHHDFLRGARARLAGDIDAAVPGIERPGLIRYRLYGGGIVRAGDAAGCFVFCEARADDPLLTRRWLDDAFAGLRAAPEPLAGLMAVHFHLSVDGGRIFIYSEWRGQPEYHRAAADPQWRRLCDFPGITPLSHNLYQHSRSLVRPGRVSRELCND